MKTVGLFVVSLLLSLPASSPASHRYPHVDANGLGCLSCHFAHGTLPDLLPEWLIHAPTDNDDTVYNNLCRHCHNDIEAPFVRTHSSITTDDRYGAWSIECRTCHDPHVQEQYFFYGGESAVFTGVITLASDNMLGSVGAGWTDNQHRGFLVVPDVGRSDMYRINGNTADALSVDGPMDPLAAAPGRTFRIVLGKLVSDGIWTPAGSRIPVRFFRESGPNSFADGDGSFDGVCEVCHTMTGYFRSSAEGNRTHRAGERCTQCHSHAAGFKFAAGGAHGPHLSLFSCDSGSQGCHGANTPPILGDGQYLQDTTQCDACHSPGGSYDGVNDPALGARANWDTGVYDGADLAVGKEKWCSGCHDESPPVIRGVAAPNVIGDEGGFYGYGVGWGFYKTGHGLAAGLYPASREPAANLECTTCHDPGTPHIDADPRTYSASGDNYREGYRLKRPMDIPRTDPGEPVSDFAVCLDCHPSSRFLVSSDNTTNFRDATSGNSHWMHLQAPPTGMWAGGGWWDSDWNGTGDSKISCPACHNVHGSPSPRMMRHGELISTPGSTDKVPSIDFRYTPYTPTPYPTLADSTGGQLNPATPGGGTVANTGICAMCHSNTVAYVRNPTDMSPWIRGVFGTPGSAILTVVFSEGVYTSPGASGALLSGDFAFVDADNGRTVTGSTHSAGSDVATLTLSSPLDLTGDFGTDTLAAATPASIFDVAGNAMDTTPVTVEQDVTAPAVSDRNPASGATAVGIQGDIFFSLSDGQSGVDRTTFSVQLSGNSGYSRIYTDLDPPVYMTGVPSGYAVTVDPDADFSYGETITVTVNAADLAGNVMPPATWSFTTVSGGTPLTTTVHPLDNAYSGIFSPLGGTWPDVLDSNDGDLTMVRSGTGAGYPLGPTSRFVVNMDDPSGLSGATILDFTVHVLARHVTAGGSPQPAAGTMQICYTTDGVNSVCSGDLGLPAVAVHTDFATATATTDSAGGPLDLADINALQVEVRRRTSGGYWLQVTEVTAVVTYLP